MVRRLPLFAVSLTRPNVIARLTFGLVAVLAVPASAPAAPPADEQEAVAKVNRAIDRGVGFLKKSFDPKTGWEGFWLNQFGDMNGGVTALGALALLNCGEKPTDEKVAAALRLLRNLPPKKTYVVALVTIVFAEARQKEDLPRIQRNVDWLIETAIRDRTKKLLGWSYPFDRDSRADASNTQYALLGLYAGKQAGAKIDDEIWRQIRGLYLTTLVKDREKADAGFWRYIEDRIAGEPKPSFTMTVAGVCGLVIAEMALAADEQKLDPRTGVAANCGRYESNDAIARGLTWTGRNFSFDEAPNIMSVFYNVYGIERVGRLTGHRFLGRYDWYREGCDFLVRTQKDDGHWTSNKGIQIDGAKGISTSFALLFLSKGRTPVLISKLAHGEYTIPTKRAGGVDIPERGMLTEKGDDPGVTGWNRKHHDVRNLTDFASRELFGGLPLGWQVYDPRRREYKGDDEILAEVGGLVQSPILYLNGHKRIVLAGQHREILKKYIEEGGFVVAEACCGSEEFATSFRVLMRELFPDNQLKPVPPEHAIWRSFFNVPPAEFPKLECLDRGCRTVLVFSPEPLAGYWEDAKFAPRSKPGEKIPPAAGRGDQAFRLGGNIIAYATGMEPPKQRLTVTKLADSSKESDAPPKGFLQPVQVRVPGESAPAPAAMRNLMTHIRETTRVDVTLRTKDLNANNPDLFGYKFLYMHGRKAFTTTDDDADNLKANLQSGGLLLADACCGRPEFDKSFREMVRKMFPDSKLEPIPADDDLYSAKLNGTKIATVKRREKPDGAGPDGGFQDLPPKLEGVKLDGRWVIVYSPYDIGCALEGHKATDCLGHTRDSALKLATAAVLYALKR